MKTDTCRHGRVLGTMLLLWAGLLGGQPADSRVDQLIKENRELQEQMRAQQRRIDELSEEVAELLKLGDRRDREYRDQKGEMPESEPATVAGLLNRVRLSGEGGIGLFRSGSEGQYPNSEFRVDEAKLFVESPVWGSVYFFGELDLTTREADDPFFRLGR